MKSPNLFSISVEFLRLQWRNFTPLTIPRSPSPCTSVVFHV
nr:MAG TPA: hypothetical protein [Crassvirales sp.]